jgi:hypothetical protein
LPSPLPADGNFRVRFRDGRLSLKKKAGGMASSPPQRRSGARVAMHEVGDLAERLIRLAQKSGVKLKDMPEIAEVLQLGAHPGAAGTLGKRFGIGQHQAPV